MWIEDKYVGLLSPQLEVFKKLKDNNYNFRCPFCGDSQKSKWKARGYIYPIKDKLNYKCHNCGHGTNLYGLLKHVDPYLAKQYNVEKFKEGKANTRVFTVESKVKDFSSDITLLELKMKSNLPGGYSPTEGLNEFFLQV